MERSCCCFIWRHTWAVIRMACRLCWTVTVILGSQLVCTVLLTSSIASLLYTLYPIRIVIGEFQICLACQIEVVGIYQFHWHVVPEFMRLITSSSSLSVMIMFPSVFPPMYCTSILASNFLYDTLYDATHDICNCVCQCYIRMFVIGPQRLAL